VNNLKKLKSDLEGHKEQLEHYKKTLEEAKQQKESSSIKSSQGNSEGKAKKEGSTKGNRQYSVDTLPGRREQVTGLQQSGDGSAVT
jgi:hypothetical protein